jgi:chromosome segregation ATPase
MLKALGTIQGDKHSVDQTTKQITQQENQINKLKHDNQSLQNKIETYSQLNCEQQLNIKNLLNELEEKNIQIEKIQSKKSDETKRLKQQSQLGQDKLKYQQGKFEIEIDDLKKKHQKELEQLKSSNEQSITRSGDLSRTNLELRKKLQASDEQCRELNEKLISQKQQLDLQLKQKKELKEDFDRKEFSLKKDLNILELMRDEYLRKNEVQQKSVEQMIDQINTFQNEINNLIQYNKNLNENLKKCKLNYEVYKKKYTELKQFIKKNDQQGSYLDSSGNYFNDVKKLQDDFVFLTPPSSSNSSSIKTRNQFLPSSDNGWYDMKLHDFDKLQ